MIKHHYPVKVLREFKNILKELKHLQVIKSDLIGTDDTRFDEMASFISTFEPNYYFRIVGFNIDKEGIVSFKVSWRPDSEVDSTATGSNETGAELIKIFKQWLSLIEEYNSLKMSEDDIITKQYEDEFYEEFDILDDDADISAFNSRQQEYLYIFFNRLEDALVLSDEKTLTPPLIIEVKKIKGNIQNFTKRQLIRETAIVFTKIRKAGLSLYLEILKEGKKELIKQIITGTFKEVIKFID